VFRLLRRRGNASTTTTLAYSIVLAAATVCYAALGSVVALLPDYVPRLGGDAAVVGLAVGAPAITGAAARPLGGRWADRYGPAPVMVAGALVMAVATLPGLVPSLPLLLASRLAVGAGEAAMMAAAVLWLLRLAGPARRGRALGHIGLANYAGLTIGPPLARLVGAGHPARVLVLAAGLPLLAAALAAVVGRGRGSSGRPTKPAEPGTTPRALLRATARPGLGLLLVNVGYVAVLGFAAAAAATHGVHLGSLAVPLFGAGVIVSRTVLGWVPDRVGATRTLTAAVLAEAAGLAAVALSPLPALTIAALLVMAVGQGLAVPALGMLALAVVPPGDHGAAGGLFFGYFDAGVGLGGPAVGLVAQHTDPTTAVLAAAGAVLAAAPAALLGRPAGGRSGDRRSIGVGGRGQRDRSARPGADSRPVQLRLGDLPILGAAVRRAVRRPKRGRRRDSVAELGNQGHHWWLIHGIILLGLVERIGVGRRAHPRNSWARTADSRRPRPGSSPAVLVLTAGFAAMLDPASTVAAAVSTTVRCARRRPRGAGDRRRRTVRSGSTPRPGSSGPWPPRGR
jgi:MFS family permease